jgi:hypothetical protein
MRSIESLERQSLTVLSGSKDGGQDGRMAGVTSCNVIENDLYEYCKYMLVCFYWYGRF